VDYSWRNLNNIYQHVLKLGMLSPPEDVIASWLLFGSKPNIETFLELGSYLGGGVGIFNQALAETGHNNVKFTGVDHLSFIGARAANTSGAWYADHFNRCLTTEEIEMLGTLTTPAEMGAWITERCERLTGVPLSLECVQTEGALGDTKYDIIHHDYGDGVDENLDTIRKCVPKLKDDGIYIVDDWCTGAPLRTWATVVAQQQGLLYPVMWGKNKVFFAKSEEAAYATIKQICANPEYNGKLFKFMPGSNYFGSGYTTIRMHWQAMQWA
jgi:hypothetical protein